MINPSLFLRRALLADAIFSGVSAVLLTLGAGALASLLNLPEALLRSAVPGPPRAPDAVRRAARADKARLSAHERA